MLTGCRAFRSQRQLGIVILAKISKHRHGVRKSLASPERK
jgi:hypothetical protein